MAKATKTAAVVANGSTLAVLTLDELLAQPDLTVVEVPELPKDGKPGIVYMRPLTAGVVIDMVVDSSNRPTGDALRTLISESICDKDGNPIFDEENVDKLRDMRLDVFNRLSTAVMKNLAPPQEAAEEGKAASSGAASSTDLPSN